MSKPGKNPSGQPVGGQWARQQKKGMEKQQQGGGDVDKARKQQQAGQGDERTPDQPIGEMAYAQRDPAKKKTGEF